MVMQAVSILEDETLQDGFMESPDIRGTGDSRVFGELNTGLWWESTQEDAPEVIIVHILGDLTSNNLIFLSAGKGAVVLPIILYLDGTWLAKGGTHSCTPLSMTIGNLPRHVMNKSSAKRVKKTVYFQCKFHYIMIRCWHTSRSWRHRSKIVSENHLVQQTGSCTTIFCEISFVAWTNVTIKAVFVQLG